MPSPSSAAKASHASRKRKLPQPGLRPAKRKKQTASQEGGKLIKQKDKLVKQAGKPAESNDKPVKQSGKFVKQAGKPAESNDKPVKQKGKLDKKPTKQVLTKKERRSMKKQQKRNGDLVSQLLTAWEELRVESTPTNRVVELCDSVLKIGKDKLTELSYSHDTARVLEAVLKRGTERHRWLMLNELGAELIKLAKSKYGRHVSIKLLKYGAKEQRNKLFNAIDGKAAELLKHKYASDLLELAYNDYANSKQRSSIMQEFYGPQLAAFKSEGLTKLSDALISVGDNQAKRNMIINSLRDNLLSLANKQLMRHSLSQQLLYEYLTNVNPLDQSVLDAARLNLVPMLHTRIGVKCSLIILSRCDSRQLKLTLKEMKTFLCTSAVNEHGYLCLLGLFEFVKNADILHKFVLRELFDSLDELTVNQYGRKVLIYMLSPRDSLHFSPQLLRLLPTEARPLEETRETLASALELCSARLLAHTAANMPRLCQDNGAALLVAEVISKCPGDKSSCYAALADLIAEPFAPNEEKKEEQRQHTIERSATHLMLKRLLPANPGLVEAIGAKVDDSGLASWLQCNRGCFFLLHLLDACPPSCDLDERIRRLRPALLALSPTELKGAQLLLSRLEKAG